LHHKNYVKWVANYFRDLAAGVIDARVARAAAKQQAKAEAAEAAKAAAERAKEEADDAEDRAIEVARLQREKDADSKRRLRKRIKIGDEEVEEQEEEGESGMDAGSDLDTGLEQADVGEESEDDLELRTEEGGQEIFDMASDAGNDAPTRCLSLHTSILSA
jgi:hypothetical protein